MRPCRLSVIVVCYRNPQLTLECLGSLRSFSPSCSNEIICVDNGSGDDIGSLIARDFPDVRFIQAGCNSGFSRACNLGIKNSRGEYVMILNNDTKITGPVFDRMVGFMDAHPKAGAVGPRHADGGGRFQISYGRYPTIATEIKLKAMNRRMSGGDPWIARRLEKFCSESRRVDWLSGSCLLLRRAALRESGLMDESFFMYFEDVDICKRVAGKGWGIYYLPEASIVHYHGRSVKENSDRCSFEYRRSQIIYAGKYHGIKGEIFMRSFLLLKFAGVGSWSAAMLCAKKLSGKDIRGIYPKAMLACKVVAMVSSSKMVRSPEPVLSE